MLWLALQFWKYFSEGRRTDESTPTFLSSRLLFFVFITHSFWEVHCSLLPLSSSSSTLTPFLCYAVLPGEHAPSKRPQRDSPLAGANRAPSPHHRLVVFVVFAAARDQLRATALAAYVCRCCSTRAWWVSRSGPAGSSPPTPPKAPAYPITTGSDAFGSPKSSAGDGETSECIFLFLFPFYFFWSAPRVADRGLPTPPQSLTCTTSWARSRIQP